MMTIIIFEWTTTWNKFVLYIYIHVKSKAQWRQSDLITRWSATAKQKSSSVFLCISSWSSVKTLLRCSFLYFLSTFMSPRCLHSLFYTSLSCFKPECVPLQQIWAFFYFPFKLNSASSTCIHHDPLISPAASHLQQSHPISPALLGASAPHLEASGAQMRSKHLSPACSVFVRVKPVFWRENYPLYLFLEMKYVIIKWFRCSWPINWSEEPICLCVCVCVCMCVRAYIYIYIYMCDHGPQNQS